MLAHTLHAFNGVWFGIKLGLNSIFPSPESRFMREAVHVDTCRCQMEAFRNGNNRIGNSVLIKARMWRQSWWCNVVVPALLERPEGEKEQELREKYIEALVSEKLLVAKDLSDFRKACGIKGNAPKSETKTRFSVIDQTCPFCCLSMSVSEKEFARHIGNCMGSFDDF